MGNKNKLKSVALLGMGALSVLALASCKHTSYKSISYNDVYATAGNYSITNGELWEQLKWDSYSVLGEKLEEAVLSSDIDEAKQALNAINGETSELTVQKQKRYLDYYELLALSELYNAAKIDDAKKLTSKELKDKAQTFIDTFYLEEGTTINSTDLEVATLEANGKKMFEGTKYETTYYMYDYYSRYTLKVAEKIFSFYYFGHINS